MTCYVSSGTLNSTKSTLSSLEYIVACRRTLAIVNFFIMLTFCFVDCHVFCIVTVCRKPKFSLDIKIRIVQKFDGQFYDRDCMQSAIQIKSDKITSLAFSADKERFKTRPKPS